MLEFGMTKADPLAATRRQRLQAYCKKKGWQNGSGTWAITEIAQHLKKPPQKISDLLNGRGAFGAKIARDLEEASEGALPAGYLDDLGQVDQRVKPPTGPQVRPPSISFSAAEVVQALGALLLAVPEEGRGEVIELAKTFALAPDSERVARRFTSALGTHVVEVPTWRDAAVELLTELVVHRKDAPLDRLVEMIDAVYSERLTQLRAPSGRAVSSRS